MRNINSFQNKLIDEIKKIDPNVSLNWDEVRGVASLVRGSLVKPALKAAAATDELTKFLKDFELIFGPADLLNSLRLSRIRTDDLGWTHVEFQMVYRPRLNFDRLKINKSFLEINQVHSKILDSKALADKIGADVFGSKLTLHFNPEGDLIEVQSSCWRDINLDNEPRVTVTELQEILSKALSNISGFKEKQRMALERKEELFPLMTMPRLVVYPWQGGFRWAWIAYTYGSMDVEDRSGKLTGARQIAFGETIVDATTGEQLLFAPTRIRAENADVGTGLGVTPLGGPFVNRNLNIVRVDNSNNYRLRDLKHEREIITYDANCNIGWSSDIPAKIMDGSIPVSEDTEGDKFWNRTPASNSNAERTASQQPEVDLHHFCREIYEWFRALGRIGWDNNDFLNNPAVPQQPIRAVAHVYDANWDFTCFTINCYHSRGLVNNQWVLYLAFFEGDGVDYVYTSGSKWLVAHEYQHAVTNCSFENGGNPGLNYAGWLGAVHEGLSDVFAGLITEEWMPSTEISPTGLVWRNLVYPRDNQAFDSNKNDHFDDRNKLTGFYERGTILAHCAYLMAQGGVHQRTSRDPIFIPVYSLGKEIIGGIDMPKAARIWYRALSYYFSTHGALSGIPSNDESVFRILRDACESAAIDIYGSGSLEHRNTVLAFYAVGLQPTSTKYGADVTFLRWGASWWMSRGFIGLPSPDWGSLDLFVNNGGSSEWNAQINIIDPSTGNPTEYENTIYCRVRNVGDEDAHDVKVKLEYAKAGTAVVNWEPVSDINGIPQELIIGTLLKGQCNFPDSKQDNPPSSASKKWYIKPFAPGEIVDHFCLRATVSCSNDVNPYNNEVQSNIGYIAYAPAKSAAIAFLVGNPTDKEIPLNLKIDANLPEGWRVRIKDFNEMNLKPKEEKHFHAVIDMQPGADTRLYPPLDGEITGKAFGSLTGKLTGTLVETKLKDQRLTGKIAANLKEIGNISGIFDGTLNTKTAELNGHVTGSFQCIGQSDSRTLCIGIDACLRPWRRVNISQLINGLPIGGITIQVQIPLLEGPCAQELPPTDTSPDQEALLALESESPLAVTGKIVSLLYDCFGDFSGFVLGLCHNKRTFYSREPDIENLVREAWEERWIVSIVPNKKNQDRVSSIEFKR